MNKKVSGMEKKDLSKKEENSGNLLSSAGLSIQSHIKITDPDTGKVILSKRA